MFAQCFEHRGCSGVLLPNNLSPVSRRARMPAAFLFQALSGTVRSASVV
jgi:hypothetical protein